MGSADSPTPPNITNKNHPTNDIIAIQYIGKLTLYSKVLIEEVNAKCAEGSL